ncbi:NAD(P)-dependent oxidoreductase [Streptomyces sp. NBC_00503]|uniref:NAD(P)-dependent oxidoreductase n=1 Tax=Streptomyces sp. NBC_00503 TaxID=2903659 RepID=UPI002E820982|nr:NAD(P)-binding domain-containing protein [Streptomyces sp. NBC_00503]WUD85284.1 NAD(P)-binding domain-containing protein [Streptomyces sp. NBC_00503]
MSKRTVTVIGLGPMGRAMAGAFLDAGYEVTVWNRTAGRAEALVARGAVEAGNLAAALEAGGPVLLSLIDVGAMYGTLGEADLNGKVLINLSSDTPERARAAAHWAKERGASYLVGAFNIPPAGMGKPESSAFYSGPHELYEEHRELLTVLTTPDFRGEEPGLAALYYQINMVMFWTAMTGYWQAAAVAQANGLSMEDFLPYATYTADSMGNFIRFYAPRIDANEHGGEVDRLTMCLSSVEHLTRTAADSGLDTSVLQAHVDLFRGGVAAGHGADSSSSLVALLRR